MKAKLIKLYCEKCGKCVGAVREKSLWLIRGTPMICRKCYTRLENDEERADDLDRMARGPAQDDSTLEFLKGIFHGGVVP